MKKGAMTRRGKRKSRYGKVQQGTRIVEFSCRQGGEEAS